MGKRIIQRARGHGSMTYRVRKSAFRFKIQYPTLTGEGIVLKLINSPAHSAPLAKIKVGKEIFYNPAFEGMTEGQKINIGKGINPGDVTTLAELPVGTRIFNIELNPNDGGKIVRTSGSSAIISKSGAERIGVMLPSKKEVLLSGSCRATIGIIAGAGRLEKPIVKAGKMHHMKKARNKLWPRTSAGKM